MPVFISHRTADDMIARAVRNRLLYHNINCYLDDVDKETGGANQNNRITALIVRRLNECTNLLALVTPNTKGSWWVPFEVGVARQAPRMITTYTNLGQGELPEFLTEWPVLRGDYAIDRFATEYKKQMQTVKSAYLSRESRDFSASASPADGTRSIDDFHRQLKTALGQ